MSEATGLVLARPAIGAYRQPVLEILSGLLDGHLTILAGDSDFEPTSRTSVDLGPALRLVRNRYLLGRRLLWQRDSWRSLVDAEVAVLELNPRILSSWAAIAVRRARGRPTVLWGHGFPRAGPQAPTDRLRRVMRRLADVVVVYTETERRDLQERQPGLVVLAAPNALYPAERIAPAPVNGSRPDSFLFVGRLVENKKPRLLLEGFIRARPDLPAGTRLVFVGDGPLRGELERAAPDDGVAFVGRVTGFEHLRDLYGRAIASVSPGAVGLAIVQSLGFGIPMALARNERHGPEVEAAQEGVNCSFFDSDSPTALAEALVHFASDRESWLARRRQIATDCARSYSADATAKGLFAAIQEARATRG